METLFFLYFGGGSKITAGGDCSYEIKRRLFLAKKEASFTNKCPSSQSYGFSGSHVWMWELDYKKVECWRTDALELWCWRRLLRVSWTSRRSKQSILKEINPGYSLERLMLKLKLQYFGHLMWRGDSLEKTLMLGKIESRRRRGQQRMRWLDGIIDWTDMSLSKLGVGDGQGNLACCSPWGQKQSDMTEPLNWTELSRFVDYYKIFQLINFLPISSCSSRFYMIVSLWF